MPPDLSRPVLIYVSTSRRLACAINGSDNQKALLSARSTGFEPITSVDTEADALAVLDRLYTHTGDPDGYFYIHGSTRLTKAEIEAEADKIEQEYQRMKREPGEIVPKQIRSK